MIPDPIKPCQCGHDRERHYTYILNGREQWRCKWCDPFLGNGRGGNFVMSDAMAKLDQAADHEFVESNIRPEAAAFMEAIKEALLKGHGHLHAFMASPEALGKLTIRGVPACAVCVFTWDNEPMMMDLTIRKVNP